MPTLASWAAQAIFEGIGSSQPTFAFAERCSNEGAIHVLKRERCGEAIYVSYSQRTMEVQRHASA
jgi:hypothetical protein